MSLGIIQRTSEFAGTRPQAMYLQQRESNLFSSKGPARFQKSYTLTLRTPPQTPNNHIPLPPPVIVSMTVEPPPTLPVPTSLQHRPHRSFRLLEENEILRPLLLLHHPIHNPIRIDSTLAQA